MSDHPALIVVRTFGSRQEADLAVSALEAAGIDALVRGDDAGRVQPGMSFSSGTSLLVRAEDTDEARAILEEPAKTEPR